MTKGRIIAIALALSLASVLSLPARSGAIFYETIRLSGSTWEYTYRVANDRLAEDIEFFYIEFEFGESTGLTAGLTPAHWVVDVFDPDLIGGFPDPGGYDAEASPGLGIKPVTVLGGFAVQFQYQGAGIPGSQYYEILDLTGFELLESGHTRPFALVPAPKTPLLLGIGLLALLVRARQPGRATWHLG